MKPHDGSGSVAAEDTQQAAFGGVSHAMGDSALDPESVQERGQPDFQCQTGAEDMEPATTMQPLMDFMTQDINLVSFGMIDEDWWRLQHGDWAMNFHS